MFLVSVSVHLDKSGNLRNTGQFLVDYALLGIKLHDSLLVEIVTNVELF